MKQKDIVLIIIVAFVAAVIAFAVTPLVFNPKKSRNQTVETVQPLTSQFNTPDPLVFNESAINPTQLIQIGDTNQPSPF